MVSSLESSVDGCRLKNEVAYLLGGKMGKNKVGKLRIAEKVKNFVSETTSTVDTAADKVLKPPKSAIAAVASSEVLKDFGGKVSESAENVLGKASKSFESTKAIISKAVPSEAIKKIGEKASQSAETTIEEISDKYVSAKTIVSENASMESLKKVGNSATDLASVETVKRVGKAVSDAATLENTVGAAKYASGIKGYNELKQAREIKKQAEENIQNATSVTEKKRDNLNSRIDKYAETKLAAINNTICLFIEYLREIGQKNKGKEYEALQSIDVKKEDIADIQDLGINAVNMAKGATGSSLLGAMALLGTKAAVLQGVTVFASASTGTAISGLSGAAATNATLAFLGGGSIASGGGGMATGAMVLGGITAGAFLAVGTLTGGILLSAHGSRALTMATKYAADVEKGVATLEKSWAIMDGISERVNELEGLTIDLEKRAVEQLKTLAAFVPDFDTKNPQHQKAFQKTALLMKSIGELANTPLIDEKGCVTENSGIVAGKIKSILNT